MSELLAFLQDMPGQLAIWTASMGPWIYVLMFAIIFAETGLIVTPFLPGDSLLFALGALTVVSSAAGEAGAIESGKALDIWVLGISLFIAAVMGDLVNYFVGRWLGLRLFKNPNSKVFNPAHLKRTHDFYEKHGGKTVIIARFAPILRTYAPFVAGVGRMAFVRFSAFNVVGGALWIATFLAAGHFFGNQPGVKRNFHYIIIAIVVISVMPAVFEFIRARREIVSKARG